MPERSGENIRAATRKKPKRVNARQLQGSVVRHSVVGQTINVF